MEDWRLRGALGTAVGAAALTMIAFLALAGSAAGLLYEDSTDKAGITFQLAGELHDPAGNDLDWPAFPEIMGSGACWADVDQDGYEDLYLIQQAYNDENPYAQPWAEDLDPSNKLYKNMGDGSFKDVTASAGLESQGHDQGCAVADATGDGYPDVALVGFGHVRLFENTGEGTFEEVTEEAGLDAVQGACGSHTCWFSGAAWADYDRDGRLDLFAYTYVDSNMTDYERGPTLSDGQRNFLFQNQGDGTFEEVAKEAGVEGRTGDSFGSNSLGALFFDHDEDGLLDLYVANDQTANEFYVNQGDGTFEDESQSSGLDDGRAGMGVAAGDYDGDGRLDLYVTHYQGQHNALFRNLGDGTFEDRSGLDGLEDDLSYVGWGAAFTDLDRDGRLDLVAANGHTEWSTTTNDHYRQPTLVFENNPIQDGSPGEVDWNETGAEIGFGEIDEHVTRGAAFADHDLDGDVDIVLVNNANETAQLLEASGVEGSWLYVDLEQPGPNPDAIGARVTVEAGEATMVRELRAGSSYQSQNTQLVPFGLGEDEIVDRVEVRWPDGETTSVEDVPVERVIRVNRSTGTFTTDTLSPITRLAVDGEPVEEEWFTQPSVEVTLVSEDRAVGEASGVAWVQHRVEEGPWEPYEGETYSFGEGEHTIMVQSMDEAGNRQPATPLDVRVDATPPSLEHVVDGEVGDNGWYVANVTLEIVAEDETSGVDFVEYRVDGGSWIEYNGVASIEKEGAYDVEFRAFDVAGNAAAGSVPVKLDATDPELQVVQPVNGSVYVGDREVENTRADPAVVITGPEEDARVGTAFPVSANAQDATSGVELVTFRVNELAIATAREAPYAGVWETSLFAQGVHSFRAVVEDAAGNRNASAVTVVLGSASSGSLEATLTRGPAGPVPWIDDASRARGVGGWVDVAFAGTPLSSLAIGEASWAR